MPKGLTAERIASYRANGFLYPNDALSAAETQRHDQTFKAYLESFYEQLGLAEKDVPADLAALAP